MRIDFSILMNDPAKSQISSELKSDESRRDLEKLPSISIGGMAFTLTLPLPQGED